MSAAGISEIEIPGYRVLGALGQGGMASVFLAVQENFGREVALKLVSTRYRDDESFAARFMREAKIVAQMRHSNIVSVYDVGNHHGQLFLSMELLDADLKSRIGNGLPEKEAARVCIAIASALSYAHEKGYLHRDIKPENVLFRGDGTPVLTDFGIARALQSNEAMTQSGMLVGTPSYMSPEQARGEPVDQRTDIYALGVLFYELLTGVVPYKATSAVSTALKHISDPIPELSAPLKHWNPFLQTILAKHPDERFQNCREVISALAITANITDSDDSSSTAIINAAEMAALMRKQEKLAPTRKQGEPARLLTEEERILAQPIVPRVHHKARSRRRHMGLFVPTLLVSIMGGAFVLYELGIIGPSIRQFAEITPSAPANEAGGAVERNADNDVVESPKETVAATVQSTPATFDAPPDADAAAPEANTSSERTAPTTKAPASTTPSAGTDTAAIAETQEPPKTVAVDKPVQTRSAPVAERTKPVVAQKAEPELEPAPMVPRRGRPVLEDVEPAHVFVPIGSVAPRQFDRFQQAFENRDINALRAVAVISAGNQQLAQRLFANYNGIRLKLAGTTSDAAINEMRARFVIDEIRNSQGQMVEPGEHWKTLPVTARINAIGNVLLFW